MTRRKLTESDLIAPEMLNVKNWPQVLQDNLSEKDKGIYFKRKKAIDMYLNDVALHVIREKTHIDAASLRRLLRRCLLINEETGELLGYRGLIPQKQVKRYKRHSPEVTNHSGMFTWLLDTYPPLKETIERYFFQKTTRMVTDPKMKANHIHRKFIEECRQLGIQANMYPFTTETLAKRSLERYLKKLEKNSFTQAARRHGEASAKIASTTGIGARNHASIIRPLERVQFDGHRIDGIFVITFRTPEGDLITRELHRLWLLVILDVASRAVIGYHLSTNLEYSAIDVLQCIKNAVVPKVKKELTIPGLRHSDRGGFPSERIPEMEWGLWDEMLYDNGKANLSRLVSERLDEIIGCSTNAGPVAVPVRRGYIERFFGVLEENGFHRMINTTGSNPKDPRRNDPIKKAIQYAILFEHLEQIMDVLISDYNGTVNEGINNFTPLELLTQRIERGLLPRVMSEEARGEALFFSMKVKRKITGSVKDGRRPFIHYEGVDYRNDILSRSPGMIGITLDLLVNTEDLRVIHAFLPDGSEFGSLTGTGKWGVVPHTLQLRKEINRLKKRKLIHFTSEENPIDSYHRFLESQAITNKASRNRLAEQQRRQRKQVEETRTMPEKATEELPVSGKSESQKKTEAGVTRVAKNFKTITF